jgi:hypothetical protein
VDPQYFAPGIFGADIRWRARPIRPLFDPDVESVGVNRIGSFTGAETSSSELETASSAPGTAKPKPMRRLRAHVRRPPAQSSFRSGIAVPGDPIFLVVKFRRDGPWARGVVEG